MGEEIALFKWRASDSMRLYWGVTANDSSALRSSDGLGWPRRKDPAVDDAECPVTDGLRWVCCRKCCERLEQ